MLNKNAQKWVVALRSGKYGQVRGRLHIKGEGYCCMGVACNLFMEDGNELEVTERAIDGDKAVVMQYDGHDDLPPAPVVNWLGLSTPMGSFKSADGTGLEFLTNLNDFGHSFQEIAAIIESRPEGLFEEGGKHESSGG